MDAILSHISPETIAALVLWIVSEILGATEKTRANGVIQGAGVLTQKAIQGLAGLAAPAPAMDAVAIQAEIERQINLRLADLAAKAAPTEPQPASDESTSTATPQA